MPDLAKAIELAIAVIRKRTPGYWNRTSRENHMMWLCDVLEGIAKQAVAEFFDVHVSTTQAEHNAGCYLRAAIAESQKATGGQP